MVPKPFMRWIRLKLTKLEGHALKRLVTSRWCDTLTCGQIYYSQVWGEDLWSVSGRQHRHLHRTSHCCFPHPDHMAQKVKT